MLTTQSILLCGVLDCLTTMVVFLKLKFELIWPGLFGVMGDHGVYYGAGGELPKCVPWFLVSVGFPPLRNEFQWVNFPNSSSDHKSTTQGAVFLWMSSVSMMLAAASVAPPLKPP